MLRSLILLTLLTIAWGFNWSVMKIGVAQLPPLWFRAIGLVIGTALLGVLLALRGTSLRIARGSVGPVAWLSTLNIVVWYVLVTVAITRLPAGRAAILGFTMPAWAALIGTVFHREPIDARVATAVLCAVVSVVLLVAGDWHALAGHPLGVGLMLAAAISWAFGTHAMKRSRVSMDTLVLTFWMMAIACPIVVATSFVFEGARWRMPTGVEWLPILYSAVVVLAIGNAIWFMIARTVPATIAGLSSMMTPVVGVFSAMAMLDESPTWRDFTALGLICVAVAIALVRHPDGRDA